MSKKQRPGKRHRVVALAYDGLCTFEFGCVVELFALERPELGVDWYDFSVCAAERGPLRAAGGIEVRVPNSLALLDQADTIVIHYVASARHTSEERDSARSAPACSC
jgi:AraC family transcriptional regulator, transcriptional activator FtrA